MIYFIGAGPGAADLITVKGKELLENATCASMLAPWLIPIF